MTRAITTELLDRHCSAEPASLTPREALNAVSALGNLSPWWLDPGVLNRAECLAGPRVAGLRQAQLPARPGGCWVLLVRKPGWQALRPGLVVPLAWQEGPAEHDPRLPGRLRQEADRVVAALQKHERIRGRNWALTLAPVLGDCDLRADLGFTYGSAWASLAGGLVLAAERLHPQATVWASGAWEGNALADIGGLEQKIETAFAFAPGGHLFVPSWRVGQARELAGDRLTIGALSAAEKDPLLVLAEYLAHLGAEPPAPRTSEDEEQLAICRAYYERQPRGGTRTEDYYWERLLPAIIERCRKSIQKRWGDWSVDYFITIASNNPALVPLGTCALGARNVLVLYTPEDRRVLPGVKRIEDYFKAKGLPCRPPADFTHGPREQLLPRFRELVRAFLPPAVPPERVAFDVTPGKKVMSVTLADIAPAGSWLLYLDHTALYDRASPGTEDFDRWRAGEGRGLEA